VTEPAAAGTPGTSFRSRFDRPIFIVSPPRSGSTLLFETLAQAPDLYTVGDESHGIIEGIAELSMPARGWTSNRLTVDDARPELVERLAQSFYNALRDRDGRAAAGRVRMLEKTPKNALRVPFFNAAWPDASFVYLYRDPRQTLASMIEAWRSGRFRTYRRLPGWRGDPWSLLLVPGWQELIGLPLPQVVARQWAITTDILLDDLGQIPRERLRAIAHDDFLAAPGAGIEALAASLELGWDRPLGGELPLSKYTLSEPRADKWRAIADVIATVWPIVEASDARARAFIARLRA
jgi:hypothetical protein